MHVVEAVPVEDETPEDRRLRHLWKKGQSGNPSGRPKNIPNKATLAIRDFCRGIIASPKYRKTLRKRIEEESLPPAIEALIWHHAYGKPKETVVLEDGRKSLREMLASMTEAQQLEARALVSKFHELLQERKALGDGGGE